MSEIQRFATSQLRALWDEYHCKNGGGTWSDPTFYGYKIGGVPTVAVDAYHALERALMSEGYKATNVWAYNCRPIASSGLPSLHSYGIAIDIDPAENPQANVPPYSGKFTEAQVDAVMGIRISSGKHLWWWGGFWSGSTTPDLMHWQLDCTPTEALHIDWTTVPGGVVIPPEPEPIPEPDPWEEWWMGLSDRKKAAFDAMDDKAFEEMTQAWQKGVMKPPDGKALNENSMYNVVRFYRVIADRGGQSTGDPSKVANQVVIKE